MATQRPPLVICRDVARRRRAWRSITQATPAGAYRRAPAPGRQDKQGPTWAYPAIAAWHGWGCWNRSPIAILGARRSCGHITLPAQRDNGWTAIKL